MLEVCSLNKLLLTDNNISSGVNFGPPNLFLLFVVVLLFHLVRVVVTQEVVVIYIFIILTLI